MVPHRGTNWAALWLTAQIGRDAVLSESYGRGYLREANPHTYVAHSPIHTYNYLQQPMTKRLVMFLNKNLKERNKGFLPQAQTSIGRSIYHLSWHQPPLSAQRTKIKLVAQHLAYCFIGFGNHQGGV